MLRNLFQEELKNAMKSRDETRTATLRLILAALKDRDIAARSKGNTDGIGEDEILGMLQSMIKQRQESIKMYEQGNRPELAAIEQGEVDVIRSFMPAQLSEEDVRAAIKTVIAETGATGVKDMGKVMAEMKSRYTGQIDFAKASGLVKELLTA